MLDDDRLTLVTLHFVYDGVHSLYYHINRRDSRVDYYVSAKQTNSLFEATSKHFTFHAKMQ